MTTNLPRGHQPVVRIQSTAHTAVLLVHGIVSTPRHFDFLMPLIPQNWSVCNLLLAGHGGSVADFGRASMKKWKEQVDAVLARLCRQHTDVLVVGYSMGSLLTIELVKKHPQIKAMLLLNPPLCPQVRPVMTVRSLKFAFGKVNAENPFELATYEDISVALEPKLWRYVTWIPHFWQLLKLCRQCRQVAATLPIPCRVFFSKQDELVRLCSRRYFDKNPNARCFVFEHSGHCYYEPAFLQAVNKSFLSLTQKMH